MKTQTCLCRFICLGTVAALLVYDAINVFAQGAGKETPAAGRVASSPGYDLEITDGLLVWNGAKRKDNAKLVPPSLENVVELLRELHPEANFALSPELAGAAIADFKMRASSVEDMLEAIRIAGGSQFLWHNARATPIDPATGLPATPGNKPGPALFVLESSPTEPKLGLQVEAFNIGTYLNSFNSLSGNGTEEERKKRMEQMEQMVRETVNDYSEISRASSNSKMKALSMPSIRFHRGANLVIIIGEPEVVGVAAKVIGALPGAQRSVAANAPGYGDPSQKSDEVIKRLQRDGVLPASRR